ncbi:MAG: HEAT repeat domain-containing protein [Planctomycetes bacterium]|nr:HEAT repeat domain-containing protein [Planctomycetota bacterium]
MMKIHFCDLCNESVPQSDLDQGRAQMVKGRVVCSVCERAMSLAPSSVRALGAEAAITAPAQGSSPQPEFAAPAAAQGTVANNGSAAVWMAAASLIVCAIVIYVFQQRIDRLEGTDLDLARGIEFQRGDVRALDAKLGRVPAETSALEKRLDGRMQESLAAGEKQRAELVAAAQRAEQAVAALQGTLAQMREDVDKGAVAREQRLDELSHRLAASEDERRALAERLDEYAQSAESARAASEAAARTLPEKAAPASAAPAWNALLPNLADANPSTRWEAVDELGRTKDPAAIEHVVPLLKDSDLFVRMCAARVLADLGTLQGVPALIDALEDAEPTVRESAWHALQTLTGKDFKFDPQANEGERSRKVKQWRDWWKKEGEPLLNGGGSGDPKQPSQKSGTQKS